MASRPTMELKLEGYEALEKTFNALPAVLQAKALRPALRAGAKVLQTSVKHAAQEMLSATDQPAPHVADTLKVKAMKRDRSRKGRIGFIVITAKRSALGITNPDTYYPAHIEYGHLVGPRTLGPLEFDAERRGVGGRFAKKDVTKAQAAASARSGRQHVPGIPFMKVGLERGRAAATAAVAEELSNRLKSMAGLEGASDAEFNADVDIGDGGEIF